MFYPLGWPRPCHSLCQTATTLPPSASAASRAARLEIGQRAWMDVRHFHGRKAFRFLDDEPAGFLWVAFACNGDHAFLNVLAINDLRHGLIKPPLSLRRADDGRKAAEGRNERATRL